MQLRVERIEMLTKNTALCALLAFSLPIAVAESEQNAVLRWNDAILSAIRVSGVPAPIAARALAIIHTAMFDAWAAYDPHALGTQYGHALRRPAGEATLA